MKVLFLIIFVIVHIYLLNFSISFLCLSTLKYLEFSVRQRCLILIFYI